MCITECRNCNNVFVQYSLFSPSLICFLCVPIELRNTIYVFYFGGIFYVSYWEENRIY